ncbi:hypothetical protein ABK040_012600 [Willaertia magna]
MFETSRICMGGLLWKQQRFNQLRKRRARALLKRVNSVEQELKYPYVDFNATAPTTSEVKLENINLNDTNQRQELLNRMNNVLYKSAEQFKVPFPKKQL